MWGFSWLHRFVTDNMNLPEASRATVAVGCLALLFGIPALGDAHTTLATLLLGEERAAWLSLWLFVFGATSMLAVIAMYGRDKRLARARLALPDRATPLEPKRQLLISTSGQPLTHADLDELETWPAASVLPNLAAKGRQGAWPWVTVIARSAWFHRARLERVVVFYTSPQPGSAFGQADPEMRRFAAFLSNWLTVGHRTRVEVAHQDLPTVDDVEAVRAAVSRQLADGFVDADDKVVEVTLATAGWTAGATLAAILGGAQVSFIPQAPDTQGEIGGVVGPVPRLARTRLARILWDDQR